MGSNKLRLFNKISFLTLLGTFFLSIFFFIPYASVTLEASKGFLLFVGVTISIFFWLIARMIDGKFTIPHDRIIFFALLLPVVALLASFTSVSPYLSLFGRGFETGTFGSMLIFFLTLFLSAVYFQTEKRLKYFYRLLFLGAGILAILEVFFIFCTANGLLPGFFSSITNGNLFGSWNDFGFFFGGVLVLALVTLELKPLKDKPRMWLTILAGLSIFALVLVNNLFLWILTGIFALVIFVYSISFHRAQIEHTIEGSHLDKVFPVVSFFVVLVCLLFIIGNNSIGSFVSNYFGISNINVSPSKLGTLGITKSMVSQYPLLGTGPNTFAIDWSMWKSPLILQTQFWNVDFSAGFGLIPTIAVTTGIIGIISWILFLGVFFLRGLQSIRVALQSTSSNYLIMSSLFLSIYFWIILLLSNPNITIVMLAFATSGMFLGVLVSKKVLPLYDTSFLKDPRTSFFSILGLVVLMIASISATYIYAEKFVAISYFSKASSAGSDLRSLSEAEAQVVKALTLDKNDTYYRGLSQVYVAQMQAVMSDKSLSADVLKSSLQNLVTKSENASNLAIQQNPKYYLNWVNLGDLYTTFVMAGISDGYDNAVSAYTKAIAYAPNNPSILLARAKLEIAHKNNQLAREFLDQALQMKPDYVDAIFAQASINLSEGNTREAIAKVEHASTLAPNNPNVFFRLGMLRYNSFDYVGAVGAFETAITLNPTYWDARYYLGLSYQKTNRPTEAKKQFGILNKYVPNNKDIQNALNGTDMSSASVIPPNTDSTNEQLKEPTN